MIRISVLCATFLFISTVLALGQDAGTLSGRVVDPNGQPVIGASVALELAVPNEPPLGKAVSAADGTFSISVANKEWAPHLHRQSSVTLLVQADGFAANYVAGRHLALFPGHVKQLGDIPLGEGQSFTGTILGSDGKPLKDAVIECSTHRHYMGHTIMPVGNVIEIKTDEYGRYKTPPLPQGIRSYAVRARNHALSGLPKDFSEEPVLIGVMPELKLIAEEPIVGSLVDARGEPVRDQEIQFSQWKTKTDDQGRFELHSAGPMTQIKILRPGHSPINFLVTRKPDGFEYYDVQRMREIEDKLGDPREYAKALEALKVVRKSVDLTLQPVAYIRGTVVDADTNEPVAISRIVMCTFTRRANGEVVLSGCRSAQFKQPKLGTFELDYWFPTEYHLAISAPGYQDAEAFTPLVFAREDVDGIEVKMTRKAGSENGVASFQQKIRGGVTENGKPLLGARVGLWMLPRKWNAANVAILRGRTTTGDGNVIRSIVATDGEFELDVPFQGDQWYVIAETSQRVIAMAGPFDVTKGNIKPVEVVAQAAGGLRGRVSNPAATPQRLHAILFSDVGLQYEVPVEKDGRFEFRNVLPGEYGLKVGCDMVLDTEVPTFAYDAPPEERIKAHNLEATPWKRATKVRIEEGKLVEDVTVEYEK